MMNDIDSAASPSNTFIQRQNPLVNSQFYPSNRNHINQSYSQGQLDPSHSAQNQHLNQPRQPLQQQSPVSANTSPSVLHTQPQRSTTTTSIRSIPPHQNPSAAWNQPNLRHYRQSPLHPSSKLYSQPPQVFNSEWLDDDIQSPLNSPTGKKNHLEAKMSTTATTIPAQTMATTPLKLKADGGAAAISTSMSRGLNYITPVSDRVVDLDPQPMADVSMSNSNASLASSSTLPSQQLQQQQKQMTQQRGGARISQWKIFWAMLNDIVGKDKFAKLGQYTLRLLVFHANSTQHYLSDDVLNIKSINLRYNDSEKQLDLIRNFIKHPADFIRIIVILVSSIFKTRVAGLITGLGMYRQFLRFGKTPFRVRDIVVKFQQNVQLKSNNELQINRSEIFNRKTLAMFASLYYGINDESLLLYKVNFLTNASYKDFAAKHESYAWYAETWIALYNAYENLSNLTQQEMDLKISIQVKNKAKILSKQLLGGANILHQNNPGSNSEDQKQLVEIQFKKNNAWIDIYKNLADLGFNTYTVFKIALPFPTWQIWMGIAASALSSVKLYRETRSKMVKEIQD
ncbi:uncharacterized protein LODBEIA_P42050 [Lodderomyces beijingensis]|uniref:Peroxisomal membrane protein PEX25 n=1 Tax=Lodderomyces beijingensis TaxID=1775926 RepID=A0ABP0ZSA0_9ASCO